MQVLRGIELWLLVIVLCIALLLSSLESTIVATALVSISNEFNSYAQSNWIVIAYLVAYSSFLIIFARLSDLTGRKAAFLAGLSCFTVASLACGLARSFTELVIFRAFQGIGGSGVFSLVLVISAEITPPEQYGIVSAMIGLVFALASGVGPVIGGAITVSTTWRWCFYFNVPIGALLILCTTILCPKQSASESTFRTTFLRIDFLGCLLCLAGSILIVVPLQEGGSEYTWSSVLVITMFACGALSWSLFACWETWLAFHTTRYNTLPMLPIRVAVHRVIGTCIFTSLLTGLSFTSTIIYLPQRFQVANDLTSAQAGVGMLTLVIVSALSNIITGVVLSKRNLCMYFIFAGNCLQLVGLGLLSSLHGNRPIQAAIYGYQVILGLGFGASLCSSFVLARIEVKKEDLGKSFLAPYKVLSADNSAAPTMGAATQLRVFGGVVGVALCRAVLAAYANKGLSQIVSASILQELMSDVTVINALPASQAASVRQVFADGFAAQSRILMYIAAANVVVALFTWQKHPAKRLRDAGTGESAEKQQEAQSSDMQTHKTPSVEAIKPT